MRTSSPRALVLAMLLLVGCGDGGSGTPDAGPLPADQCINSSDLAILQALIDGLDGGVPDGGPTAPQDYPGITSHVSNPVKDCGYGECQYDVIYETPELPACMAGCLEGTPVAGLSFECTHCWVELIHCALGPCLLECLGEDIPLCYACVEDQCMPRLRECSGLNQGP